MAHFPVLIPKHPQTSQNIPAENIRADSSRDSSRSSESVHMGFIGIPAYHYMRFALKDPVQQLILGWR